MVLLDDFAGFSFDLLLVSVTFDLLCVLVVRALGYRSKGLGFDSRLYQMF
jgi:hypothetical protein